MEEASSSEYPLRTRLNVEDSDGTFVLCWGSPRGGTLLTVKLARRLKKPCLVMNLCHDADPRRVRNWLQNNDIRVLNVAGPREGEATGVHEKASAFLRKVLAPVKKEPARNR